MERRLTQQGYTFELDPNRAQRVLLAKSVGATRYVYNWGLAELQAAYEFTGKRPKHRELKAQLVELKQGECPWLYEVSAHIGQQALVDLERAFDRFFKGLKGQGPKSGFPKPASLNQEASISPRSRRGTQRRDERLAGAVTSWASPSQQKAALQS